VSIRYVNLHWRSHRGVSCATLLVHGAPPTAGAREATMAHDADGELNSPRSHVDLAGSPANRWHEGVRKCDEHGVMRGLIQALRVELDGGPRAQEFHTLLAPIVRADTARILAQDISCYIEGRSQAIIRPMPAAPLGCAAARASSQCSGSLVNRAATHGGNSACRARGSSSESLGDVAPAHLYFKRAKSFELSSETRLPPGLPAQRIGI
jgi:hypothetical protein